MRTADHNRNKFDLTDLEVAHDFSALRDGDLVRVTFAPITSDAWIRDLGDGAPSFCDARGDQIDDNILGAIARGNSLECRVSRYYGADEHIVQFVPTMFEDEDLFTFTDDDDNLPCVDVSAEHVRSITYVSSSRVCAFNGRRVELLAGGAVDIDGQLWTVSQVRRLHGLLGEHIAGRVT